VQTELEHEKNTQIFEDSYVYDLYAALEDAINKFYRSNKQITDYGWC
jgi:hypothetical protein